MPISMAATRVPGRLPMPPNTQIAKYAPDIFPSDRRLDRLDDDEECAGDRCRRNGDAERNSFDADRIDGHELKGKLILCHRHDCSARQRCEPRKAERRASDEQERHYAWHQNA